MADRRTWELSIRADLTRFRTEADVQLARLSAAADVAEANNTAQATSNAALAAIVAQFQVQLAPGQTATLQTDPLVTVLAASTLISGVTTALQGRAENGKAALPAINVQLAADRASLVTAQTAATPDPTVIASLAAHIAELTSLATAIAAGTVVAYHVTLSLPAIPPGSTAVITVMWPAAFTDATYTVDMLKVASLNITVSTAATTQCAFNASAVTVPVTAGAVLDMLAFRYS